MMRLLITMNMPSAQGNLVHQLTVEYDCANLNQCCDDLNEFQFIICKLLYKHIEGGENKWTNKGEIILNTDHIGKVQEFIDKGKYDEDESFRSSEQRSENFGRQRPSLRSRGYVL